MLSATSFQLKEKRKLIDSVSFLKSLIIPSISDFNFVTTIKLDVSTG